MNKILTTVAAAMVAGLCFPAESTAQTSMSVITPGGQTKYEITMQSRLKFDSGQLQIFSGQNKLAGYNLTDVTKIVFGLNDSGISPVLSDGQGLALKQNPVYDTLSFIGAPDAPCLVEMFSLAGHKVMTLNGWAGDDINVSNLSAGTYILRINNQIFKLIKL
ncbi:MAG: T9SS type A sorting domain-containing protein [Prevotella sp.]|nr:T9SS type A sorting domain-containing protein [Prevotella sp.]MCM1074866.1 T9SS type A sorting domain-containing protein [Ruminococcus sp.]